MVRILTFSLVSFYCGNIFAARLPISKKGNMMPFVTDKIEGFTHGKTLININHLKNEMVTNASDSILVFNKIDRHLIGDEVQGANREQLLYSYKNAVGLYFDRPYMWDLLITENSSQLRFYTYKKPDIDAKYYTSFYISINYEDAEYEGIILLTDDADTGFENKALLVYENLTSEESYKRITRQDFDNVFKTEFFINNKLIKTQFFILRNNFFVEYFKNDRMADDKWGRVEEISAPNLSGKTTEYAMKGSIKDNVKNGHWEERRYSVEYDKNVWMDGNYVDGVRNGEWNMSPDGAVDEIVLYEKGKVLKLFRP